MVGFAGFRKLFGGVRVDSYPLSRVRAAMTLAKETGLSVQTALWAVDPDPAKQEAKLARLQAAGLDVGFAPGASPNLKPLGPLADPANQEDDQELPSSTLGDAA